MYGGVVARLSGKHGRVLLAFPRDWAVLRLLMVMLPLILASGWFLGAVLLDLSTVFVTGYVALVAVGMIVFLGPAMYIGNGALHERGVVAPDSFAPWADVLGYTTWEPSGLSLTVRGTALMMPERTVELACPAAMRERAVTIIQERAPRARRMDG